MPAPSIRPAADPLDDSDRESSGVDSVMAPQAPRMAAWARLERDLDLALLDVIGGQEIGLSSTVAAANELMDGKVRGRIIVDVNK